MDWNQDLKYCVNGAYNHCVFCSEKRVLTNPFYPPVSTAWTSRPTRAMSNWRRKFCMPLKRPKDLDRNSCYLHHCTHRLLFVCAHRVPFWCCNFWMSSLCTQNRHDSIKIIVMYGASRVWPIYAPFYVAACHGRLDEYSKPPNKGHLGIRWIQLLSCSLPRDIQLNVLIWT